MRDRDLAPLTTENYKKQNIHDLFTHADLKHSLFYKMKSG